jgi:hypothetical protein
VILVSQADIAILRRVAERGLKRAQEREDNEFVDLFQHMIDEIEWLTDDPFDDDAEDYID